MQVTNTMWRFDGAAGIYFGPSANRSTDDAISSTPLSIFHVIEIIFTGMTIIELDILHGAQQRDCIISLSDSTLHTTAATISNSLLSGTDLANAEAPQ